MVDSVTREQMIAVYGADITDLKRKTDEILAIHQRMEQRTQQSARASEQHARTSLQAMNNLRQRAVLVAGTVTGLVAATAGSAFVQLADQARTMENQMKSFGVETDSAKRKVYALAMETRTPLESTVGLLRSLNNAIKGQDIERTMRQVATLNRLMVTGGLDAGQRGSVILQFSQALQSGVLSGDELRALRESAPYDLLEAIARAAGGTVDQLRKLGEQGKITTNVMVEALESLEQVSKDKFGNFQMTVGEAMTVMRTGMMAAASEINNTLGVTDNMAEVLVRVGNLFRDNAGVIAELAEALSIVAQAAMLVAGARGLGAVVGVATTAASKVAALAGSMGALRLSTIGLIGLDKALMGISSLFGGPVGLAIAAATAAAYALHLQAIRTSESLKEMYRSGERIAEIREEMRTAMVERATDVTKLEKLERDLEKAIADQAPAAEATARREIAVVRRRIKEAEDLLAAKQKLLEIEEEEQAQSFEDAKRSLAADARRGLNRMAIRNNPELSQERLRVLRDGSDAEVSAFYFKVLNGLAKVSEAEKTYIANYIAMREEQARIDAEAVRTNDAHVEEWKRNQEEMRIAFERETREIIAKANERRTKIAELVKHQESIQATIKMQPEGATREQEQALEYLKEQIAKLEDADERVAALRAKVGQLRAALEVLRNVESFAETAEEAARFEEQIDEVEYRVRNLETGIADVNDASLSEVESAMRRLGEQIPVERAAELLQQFSLMTEGGYLLDLNRFNSNVGSMNGPLPSDPARYITQMERDRINGAGGEMEQIVQAAILVAKEVGTTARAVLALWNKESSLNSQNLSDVRKNGNRYFGLTQFGPEERRQFGVPIGSDIATQAAGTIAYLKKRGFTPGMSDVQLYATVNAGNPWRTGASDIGQGGNVSSAAYDVTHNWGRHYARADAALQVYGDTAYNAGEAWERNAEATKKAADEAERLDKAQKDYIASLADANERSELEASLIGKSAYEREKLLMIHQKLKEAEAAGLEADDYIIDELGNRLTVEQAITEQVQKQLDAKYGQAMAEEALRQQAEERAKREAEAAKQLNEKLEFQKSIEQDIQNIIIGSIMRTGDWKQMVGQLIAKLAEALLMAGLFNEGPFMSKGGGGGLLGGLVDWVTGAIFKADGGVVGPQGEIPLRMYSRGGVAYRPQLAVFGEGSQPEAFVPLPDGRTIPVTIKTPDVPRPGAMGSMSRMLVEVGLRDEMLKAQIAETSGQVAAMISEDRIGKFSKRRLPGRMRQLNSDPRRID